MQKRIFKHSDIELLQLGQKLFDTYLSDAMEFDHHFPSFNSEFLETWQKEINYVQNNINNGDSERLVNSLNYIWRVLIEISYASKLVFKGNKIKLISYDVNNQKVLVLPSKITYFDYNPATFEFMWSSSKDSKLYRLERLDRTRGNENNWEESAMTPMLNIHYQPPVGDWYFRVRGFNDDGFGEPSEPLEVYVGNNLW